MRSKLSAFVCCVLLTGCAAAVANPASTTQPTEDLLDRKNPATWAEAVVAARKHAASVGASLISVAGDETRNIEERRQAIFLLGELKDPDAVRFLIRHVTLALPVGMIGGDEDMLRETPCFMVLYRGDWGMAQAILKELDSSYSHEELMHLGTALQNIVKQNLIKPVLDNELANTKAGQKRENLEQIMRLLNLKGKEEQR
jgi:methyl coenzyme M reductase subunit C-like uncharacterized protein (methanogenesis marker protein 7)